MTVEQVLAALVLAVCLALLVHHFAGARRQGQLRGWWHARAAKSRLAWNRLRLWRRTRQLRRAQQEAREASEAMKGAAAREAADVIERARQRALARGNEAGPGDADGSAGHGDGEAAGSKPGSPGRRGSDNVVRPPRFGNRRNDLH